MLRVYSIAHLDICVQAEVATPRQYSFKEGRGQVICCLLAAHAMCQLPLDLDLTYGKQHHLLRLRGDLLLVYEGCTPKQVRQTYVSSLTSSLQSIKTKHPLVSILMHVCLAFKQYLMLT